MSSRTVDPDASSTASSHSGFKISVRKRNNRCVITGYPRFDSHICHIIPQAKGDTVGVCIDALPWMLTYLQSIFIVRVICGVIGECPSKIFLTSGMVSSWKKCPTIGLITKSLPFFLSVYLLPHLLNVPLTFSPGAKFCPWV